MKPIEDSETREPSASYRERVYGSYVSTVKGRTPDDRKAAAYNEHARYFDYLFAGIAAPGSQIDVLEVACGPGHFLYWAARRNFASVRGFDLSAEQVEAALSMDLP